jgi:hypothetical protein
MDDILVLAIGRTVIELSAAREQALQALKQLQAQQQQAPPPEPTPPKE